MSDPTGAKLNVAGFSAFTEPAGVSSFFPAKLNPLAAGFAGSGFFPASLKLKPVAGVDFACSDESDAATGSTSLFARSPKLKPLDDGLGCVAVGVADEEPASALPRLPKLKLPLVEEGLISEAAGESAFLPRSPKLKVGFVVAAAEAASGLGAALSALEPNPLKPLNEGASDVAPSFGLVAGGRAKKSEAAFAGVEVLASVPSPATVEVGGNCTAVPLNFDLLVLELRMLLGLELAARAPGWKGVSSFVGRSNMPAGTELSLPKLRFESVALPKGELLGAAAAAAVGVDSATGAVDAAGVEVDPKPEKGAGEGFAGAAAGEPKPPKLKGEVDVTALEVAAPGADVDVVSELGLSALLKPAKVAVAGLPGGAAG